MIEHHCAHVATGGLKRCFVFVFRNQLNPNLRFPFSYPFPFPFPSRFSFVDFSGEETLPPILRPVELSLVPDTVDSFEGVSRAMRHCVRLCVLLHNQKGLINHTYCHRVALIQHLFVRVIPLPLPQNHPRRRSCCFWASQSMRYETQADLLRLLHLLGRHYSAASLSLRVTRSFDAARLLTLACIATVADAVLRIVAEDIPSQLSLHYSGRTPGPVHPFGFEIGTFARESEYLIFSSPEMHTARCQVLDYFKQQVRTEGPFTYSVERGVRVFATFTHIHTQQNMHTHIHTDAH